MKENKLATFLLTLLVSINFYSQETLPIFSDYLSDNVYLVHPSAAGVGICGKVRLTARNQWEGNSLQTLSAHTRLGLNAGVGLILFNDENGYHSQQGLQLTYAYHIDFDDRGYNTNQLSFGISGMAVNNSLDTQDFITPDPVFNDFVNSTSYFNADVSMAYHYSEFFSYLTAKNLLLTARNIYNDDYEPLNIRRYLVTLGYFYGEGKSFQIEPSVMGQLVERTGEKFIDLNVKFYKKIPNAQLWAGFSYRKGFDGNDTEELTYLTPIAGINYKRFMVAYTYTKQTGNFLYNDGGFHQISLGFDFMCKPKRRNGCPNIN